MPGKSWIVLRLAVIPAAAAVALFVAWKLGYFALDRRRELTAAASHVRSIPGVEVVYAAAFAVAVTLLLPAAIATLLGGALFGTAQGALLAWAGLQLGTMLAHALARRVARAPLRRLFGEHRLLRLLRERGNVAALLRLRVMPVAPFAVMDYVAGLAGVPLSRLLPATMIGVVPSVVAYAYVGSELMRGIASSSGSAHRAVLIAGAVTLVALLASVAPALIRRLRH